MNQLTGGRQLWVQGGTPQHPLNQGDPVNPVGTRFGFGALRCAQDHLNGDNVEFVSFPQNTSHVFCFYYAVSPPPTAGLITVRKQISPDSPVSTGNYPFRFDGDVSYEDTNGDGIHDFTLSPSQGRPDEQTFVRGATGDQEPWTFAEVPQPGWNPPQQAQCVSQTGESQIDAGANGATSVHLAAGDHVTCTYTNTRSLGPSAIYKETHGGTGTFPFTITQPDGTVRQETATTTAEGEAVRVAGLAGSPSGVYTMRESFPDEGGAGSWALTGVTCNGESVPFTTDATGGSASFDKAPGSENLCVFSNTFTPGGSISIDKTTQGGIGTFRYEIRQLPETPASEPVSQTFQAQATTTEQGTPATATPIGPPAEQLRVVPDAHYTIQEILPPQGPEGTWEMVDADCGPNQTGVDLATQSVDITLTRDNPRAQCHFVNRLVPPEPPPGQPSLTITKAAEEVRARQARQLHDHSRQQRVRAHGRHIRDRPGHPAEGAEAPKHLRRGMGLHPGHPGLHPQRHPQPQRHLPTDHPDSPRVLQGPQAGHQHRHGHRGRRPPNPHRDHLHHHQTRQAMQTREARKT